MKNRSIINFILILAAGTIISAGGCGFKSGPGSPLGLMCELLRQPERAIITDPQPEFSWIINDPRRGAIQTAFQLLVASDLKILDADRGDLWDSGKQSSKQSVNVNYKGRDLSPDQTYWWKVRTWDQQNKPGPFSLPQKIHTGRLENLPLKSNWVQTSDGNWLLENRQRPDYREIEPQNIITLTDKDYFVDFGKAAFGTLKITLQAIREGDSVTIYLGEKKTADNRVYKDMGYARIGLMKCVLGLKEGTHTYTIDLPRNIPRSPNRQVLAPHMPEVTPFRYAEIVNSPSEISKNDIRQVALFYYYDASASEFESSDSNLNAVWDLCQYTLQAAPFLAVYCDGNRERMPYEADAYIQQLGHYAIDREFSIARYTTQFLIFNPSWPTEWHMHSVFMAWMDYLHTGNPELLEKYYTDLKAKSLIALARSDGLISTVSGSTPPGFFKSIHYTGNSFQDIVDWPAGTPRGEKQAGNHGPTPEGERDGYVFTPVNTVVNAFHYRSLVLIGRIANVLGRVQEAERFFKRAEMVKIAFNKQFLNRTTGIYVDGIGTEHSSLHANMFPLAFGLVPDNNLSRVVAFIKSRGMACSVYGAQYLLEALFAAGETEYALQLMTSESKRSWMNMIRAGSTMTTEAWDEYFKPNLTWNHAWGSAPANIIARKLMGIEPLKPAYRTIRVKPQLGNLRYAHIKKPTIRGMVEVTWQRDEDDFILIVHIPANTEAEIWIPSAPQSVIAESGTDIYQAKDIEIVDKKDKYTICRTGAGEYHFTGKMF